MDGKFSVGYRDAVVRTVVGLDRETTAAYTLVLEAIGRLHCALNSIPHWSWQSSHRQPCRGQAWSPADSPEL